MGTRHVVAGVMGVTVGALLLGGCGWAQQSFTDDEKLGQTIRSVQFDNDAGDVKIRTGAETSVKREVHYDDDKPGDTYRVDGDVLIVESCQVRDCWVSYEIVVPDGTKVNGHVDSGSIELTGVAEANVQAESGDITVRDVAGEVNVNAQSGTIDLSGVGGAVVAGAESGDVSVGLSAARDVTAHTSSGTVTVTVPPGSYRVQASTESGDLDNQLPDDASGTHQIDAHSESGDVTVKQS